MIQNWHARPNAAILHLESELESFAPSIFDKVDEYEIISAASMSDSVDDTTQYLDDS